MPQRYKLLLFWPNSDTFFRMKIRFFFLAAGMPTLLPHHRHASRHRCRFRAAGLVPHDDRIHAVRGVRTVPAVGLLLRAEHQGAPAVIDLHAVFLNLVRVAENRQEDRVHPIPCE